MPHQPSVSLLSHSHQISEDTDIKEVIQSTLQHRKADISVQPWITQKYIIHMTTTFVFNVPKLYDDFLSDNINYNTSCITISLRATC